MITAETSFRFSSLQFKEIRRDLLLPFGKSFDAFLFDMDGTILSSIEATERVWAEWAKQHGIDPVTFLPTIHGVRAVETVRRLALPGVDPVREAKILMQAEMADLEGIAPSKAQANS